VRRLALVILLAASLALAGCSKDDPVPAASGTSPSSSPSEPAPEFWPLTGLEAKPGQSVALDHPVLVTKIDNTYASQPQVGLSHADLVVEELVEGGLTRLAVFFYSDVPPQVGPVRSMRASDIGIVTPAEASVVTSGAAARTIARIKDAGITYYTEGAKGIYRSQARSAPYNLFADLTVIAKTAKAKAATPPDYLPWGDPADLPKGKPAKTIGAQFSGGHTSEWSYRGGHYLNTNSNAGADDQFPADTILVLRVQVGDAGYLDPAGNPVPETKLEGTGPCQLFHGGRMVPCTWSKDSLESPITLSSKTGEMTVPAGHTWIELVPAATGDVTFSK